MLYLYLVDIIDTETPMTAVLMLVKVVGGKNMLPKNLNVDENFHHSGEINSMLVNMYEIVCWYFHSIFPIVSIVSILSRM